MWAGIRGEEIVGAIFIERTLNFGVHLEMIESVFDSGREEKTNVTLVYIHKPRRCGVIEKSYYLNKTVFTK